MPVPTTADDLVALIRKSNLLDPAALDAYLAAHPGPFDDAAALCARMRADGLLGAFHVEQLLRGKYRGFFLGKHKLLDRIGLGGMGQVFLAEHVNMRRRVAIKVLPPDRAQNEFSRERFLREARAAAALDHPNIVRIFDIGQNGSMHFLVMEYVDGQTFDKIIQQSGSIACGRAVEYVTQAAAGWPSRCCRSTRPRTRRAWSASTGKRGRSPPWTTRTSSGPTTSTRTTTCTSWSWSTWTGRACRT